MKLTNCPCRGCSKRTPDCRLSCGRYKVYHAAKMKEYEKRLAEYKARSDLYGHIQKAVERAKKRTIKYTPVKNGALKKG